MNKLDIANSIKKVMLALINNDVQSLSSYCQDSIKPEYLFQEIKEYPGNMTMPSEEAFLIYEELPIDLNNKVVWFNLWFDDKKSDLILELRLEDKENGEIRSMIRNLRVM